LSTAPEDLVADAVAAAIVSASLTLPASPSNLAFPVERRNYPHVDDFREIDIIALVYTGEVKTERASRRDVQTDVSVSTMVGINAGRSDLVTQTNVKELGYEIEKVMRGAGGFSGFVWVTVERIPFVPDWFEKGLFASIITAGYRRLGEI